MTDEEIEKEFEKWYEWTVPNPISEQGRVNKSYAKLGYLAGRRKGEEQVKILEAALEDTMNGQGKRILELEADLARSQYQSTLAIGEIERLEEDISVAEKRGKELEEGIKIWKLNGDYDLTYGPDRDLIKLIDKEKP